MHQIIIRNSSGGRSFSFSAEVSNLISGSKQFEQALASLHMDWGLNWILFPNEQVESAKEVFRRFLKEVEFVY